MRSGLRRAAREVREQEKELLDCWMTTAHPVYKTMHSQLRAVRWKLLKLARQADRECGCPTSNSR